MSDDFSWPEHFLWGAATAAHQVEGGNRNDWSRWESSPQTRAVEPAGRGIDHFHRYDADLELLASLGHNAHRFSLEWSRIEPQRDEISAEALAHYRAVLLSAHRHGLTPVVTLQHKTLPLWFADAGGWEAPDAIGRFARYVEVVRDALGDLMTWVCTINEPQMISVFGYLLGDFPPAKRDLATARAVNSTLMAAHRRAVAVLRADGVDRKIGICEQLIPLAAQDPSSSADVELAALLTELATDSHVRDLAAPGDTGDFVGLQFYTRAFVDASSPTVLALPTDGVRTQMGWEIYPEGLALMLRKAAESGLPVLITENGIATDDDTQRAVFLLEHLRVLASELEQGAEVLGYLHWSAFDNFEWNHGYVPTFGLIEIDRDDGLARRPRPSALAFAEVIRSRSLEPLVAHVARELVQAR